MERWCDLWMTCRYNRLFHYGLKFYVVVAGTSVVLISLTVHSKFIAENKTFYIMLALIVTYGLAAADKCRLLGTLLHDPVCMRCWVASRAQDWHKAVQCCVVFDERQTSPAPRLAV